MQLENRGDDTAFFQSSVQGGSMPPYSNPYWSFSGEPPVSRLSTARVCTCTHRELMMSSSYASLHMLMIH